MSPQLAALLVVVIIMGAAWYARRAVYAGLRAGMAMNIWTDLSNATSAGDIVRMAAKNLSTKWLSAAVFYQAVVITFAVAAGGLWGRFL